MLKQGKVSEDDKERIFKNVIHSDKKHRSFKVIPVLALASCLMVFIILGSTGGFASFVDTTQSDDHEDIIDKSNGNDKEISKESEETEEDVSGLIVPTEDAFMETLYAMTNQKVLTEFTFTEEEENMWHPDQYHFVEITEERIDEMILILDKAKETKKYFNHDYYSRALKEWEKGNFDNAIDVHNELWLFIGTSIQAKRLLTKEEERTYLEKDHTDRYEDFMSQDRTKKKEE